MLHFGFSISRAIRLAKPEQIFHFFNNNKFTIMSAKKPNKTPVSKTVITISPDGHITISKTEETITEQVMLKPEAS